MSRRSSCSVAGAALVLSLLSPGDAVAQVAIGADASALHGGTNAAWGFGIDGRFGYRTGFPRAWIVHSVIVQFEGIGGIRQLLAQPDDLDIKTLGGGIRIGGALSWFQPFVFSHLSVANALGDWGYFVDLGGALDWRLRTLSVGVHYAHDWLHIAPGGQQFNEFGVHVEARGFWL